MHKPLISAPVEKVTVRAVVVILLAASFYFYEFIMQAALGVMQRELLRDLAINATTLGVISGCFYLPYTLLQLPAGLLLDRLGARVILTSICLLFALGVLLFAHAQGAALAGLARFIMGGAASCAFISILHLAARWVAPAYFSLFVGIAEMLGALGGLASTTLLALMLNYAHWRTIMCVFAYVGFMLALILAGCIRNRPPVVVEPESDAKSGLHSSSVWQDLRAIMGKSSTWSIGLYSFFIWAPAIGLSLWGVDFLVLAAKLQRDQAANMITFMWVGVAVISPLLGWCSSLIGRRKDLLTVCALVGAIALGLLLFLSHLTPGWLMLLLFLVGLSCAGQTLTFSLIKDNHDLCRNSAANGLNNMFIVASGILFQPVIGKILDRCWAGTLVHAVRVYDMPAYQAALVILPVCCLLATGISLFWIQEAATVTSTQDAR